MSNKTKAILIIENKQKIELSDKDVDFLLSEMDNLSSPPIKLVRAAKRFAKLYPKETTYSIVFE